MKFTFIYPYKPINGQSLDNIPLSMLEYISLRFANYLDYLGASVNIYSQNPTTEIRNNITYSNLSQASKDNHDNLIVIDSFDYLELPATKKYSWISSAIENISQRKNAVNIINHNAKIITFAELGGDFEIPYAIMEHNSPFHEDFSPSESEYAIITTNPAHGLKEITDLWDNSLIDLYILSKTLNNTNKKQFIPTNSHNIHIIEPKNTDHIVDTIRNARFHITPHLPPAIFNSFAIQAQYYGVPTLSYKYMYDRILHKNNMAGQNTKNKKELSYYIQEFSTNTPLITTLSHQATTIRAPLTPEKIFQDLASIYGLIL